MYNLILVRHGQSQWNLENRFTGWYDSDLTEKGIEEAKQAGFLIKNLNINFNFAFTSFQKRAILTLDEINKKLPDLVILDVLLDEKNRDGIDILKFIKSIDTDVPVIMISGHANIKIAVDSIKLGAFEFLEKPFNKDRLLNFVNRAIETSLLKKENKLLPPHPASKKYFN